MTINVYDIATDKWLTQTTSSEEAEFPNIDMDLCSASASSNGSSEIYLYGTSRTAERRYETMDEDVWVLTIPAFRWFRLGGATARRPLGGHSCEIVGSSFVTVGGIGVGGDVDAEHSEEQILCEPSPFRVYDLEELEVRPFHWHLTAHPKACPYTVLFPY